MKFRAESIRTMREFNAWSKLKEYLKKNEKENLQNNNRTIWMRNMENEPKRFALEVFEKIVLKRAGKQSKNYMETIYSWYGTSSKYELVRTHREDGGCEDGKKDID